jgi:3-methylcrotonyl-CoA carboxylase beta subunit
MGGEQAASVLATVREDGMKARGQAPTDAEQEEFMSGIREQYEHQGHPFYSSARLWDDGVIAPKDTRRVVSLALRVAARTPTAKESSYGVFRM